MAQQRKPTTGKQIQIGNGVEVRRVKQGEGGVAGWLLGWAKVQGQGGCTMELASWRIWWQGAGVREKHS